MVRALLLTLGLVACGGPVEQTLVDELRVLAAIPDRPEVAPGEAFGLDVLALDPAGEGFRSLAWVCTPTGPPGAPCLEQAGGTTLGWASAVDASGRAEGLQVSAALAGALASDEDLEEIAVPVWVLTCAPELCPVIERAPRTYRVDVAWDDVAAGLSDPTALVADLPLQGVALTRRSVLVSLRPASERNAHPRITSAPTDTLVAPADASVDLVLDVEDAESVSAYGYTTVGGFDAVEVLEEDGRVELAWFPAADSEPGSSAELAIVVADGRGGEALWRGAGRVDPPLGVD